MSDLEIILAKLRTLGLEDTRRLADAVRDHLEKLNGGAGPEASPAPEDETVPLTAIISEFREGLDEGSH